MSNYTSAPARTGLRTLARWTGVVVAALTMFVFLLGVQVFFVTGYEFSRAGFTDYVCETIAYASDTPPVMAVHSRQDDSVHHVFVFEHHARITEMLGTPDAVRPEYWYIVPVKASLYGEAKLTCFGGKLCKLERLHAPVVGSGRGPDSRR